MSIAARRLQRAQLASQLYQGTSNGPLGYRISEMFGGDGNGSWINTPMPANTSVHADSATAVADLCYNIYEKATGTNVAAWPIINAGNYCATINVIPHNTPLVKVWSSELP